ncbi:hypothetical protein KKD62_00010 [Patescibacteria group bacterium]|nr:hypothetical protein [Patescibacteria group bacterium]
MFKKIYNRHIVTVIKKLKIHLPIKFSKILLFFTSLIIVTFGFYYFVENYHFPTASKELRKQYLGWVASRISPNIPYKYWWPLAFGIIPSITFLLWYCLCFVLKIKVKPKKFLDRSVEKIKKFEALEIGLITILIVFLLFNFAYNAFYQFFYNYHHFNFITGPLNDVLNGKYLLIDSKTQYGFLNILLASFLFKLGFYFSHANVHLLSMILGVVEYLCLYAIIRVLTKSYFWAVFGIIFTTSVHFYGVFPALFPSELFMWPGGSVWRFFPAMPAALLVLLWQKTRSRKYLYLSQIMITIAFFWNLESGISLLLGYIGFLLIEFHNSKEKDSQKLKLLFLRLVELAATFLAIVVLYSLYTLILAGQFPKWNQLFYYVSLFNNGFLQYPNRPPLFGIVYLPIAIYALVILSSLIRRYFKRGLPINDLSFLTLLATYGYGIYRYYISKQSPSDLGAVMIPATIIIVYLLYQFSECFFSHSFFQKQSQLKKIFYFIFFTYVITLNFILGNIKSISTTFPLKAILITITMAYCFYRGFKFLYSHPFFQKRPYDLRKFFSLLVGYFIILMAFTPSIHKFFKWEKKLRLHRLQDFKDMRNDPNFNYPSKNRLIAIENTAVPTIPITELMTTAEAIKAYTSGQKKIAFLGYFDHMLLMQADRVNLADYNYMHATLYSKKEFDEVLQIYLAGPKYLFIDKRILQRASEYLSIPDMLGEKTLIDLFTQIRDKYEFEKDIGMVYVYKKID